jgi:cytochrome c2
MFLFSRFGGARLRKSNAHVVTVVLAVIAICAYSLVLIAAGAWSQKRGYPGAIRDQLTSAIGSLFDRRAVVWKEHNTNLHTLEISTIKIGNGLGYGGGLGEIEGHVVFASSKGRLGYLDRQKRVHRLAIDVPMNLVELRKNPRYDDPLYAYDTIRVTDILPIRTSAKRYALYVSHHTYKPGCIQFKVSRRDIRVTDTGLLPATSQWQEVFVARPHCIPDKSSGYRFVGQQSGGRLAQHEAGKLLLTVGDHQFDGFNSGWPASMDPSSDLGKIVEIDLVTLESRIFASGLRNPQGLTVTRAGAIWETEHGPQGGDEVNLIKRGENYGWPRVTYGVNYGYPRRDWPLSSRQGAHDNYRKPAFAFVPSIGISNIIEPETKEFPNWHNSLIVASLRASKLYVLRTEGEHIHYAEPIELGAGRIRDLISLSSGEFAFLTDKGAVGFVRNAELHKNDPGSFVVSGLTQLSQAHREEKRRLPRSPVERGRHIFNSECATCHSLDGKESVGPPLNGVVGRPIGGVAEYQYSTALSGRGIVWTHALLTSYLTEPYKRFSGSKMPPPKVSWYEVPYLVKFLGTVQGGGQMGSDMAGARSTTQIK